MKRSQTLGFYAPNRFLITLGPGHWLVDKNLQPFEQKPELLAVVVHEYLHYLHNVSTVTGFWEFAQACELWARFRTVVSADGKSLGSNDMKEDVRAEAYAFHSLGVVHDGDSDFDDDISDVKLENIEKRDVSHQFGGECFPKTEVTVTFTTHKGNLKGQVKYKFGAVAIAEGIAYEIDHRISASGVAMPLTDNAPIFPYQVLRHIGRFISPGISDVPILKLGLISYLTPDPAQFFIDVLYDYEKQRQNGLSESEALNAVSSRAKSTFENCIDVVVQDISLYRTRFCSGGQVGQGIGYILDAFKKHLRRRQKDPFFELRIIKADGSIDFDYLRQLLKDIPPCLILQEGEGDRHEIEKDILVDTTGAEVSTLNGIRAMHAAFDYALMHFDRAEILKTDEIAYSCPFATACNLDLRQKHPFTCMEAPWRALSWSEWAGGNSCWFGVGCAESKGEQRNK